ncbi:hypothetical protein PUR59_11740 [Streptomyces sp. SP18ES09]|uniref:hypothetical protein n=1 Tax=Streptomyces sp. SP18ES09 TaxID=3002532 RepID=UPI002E77D494|nr:hypothetical protein [Streptomyces sp. SP18ES09]MEE1815678.1 hypothetical protein [Streptomyces sp. SP18ES09]
MHRTRTTARILVGAAVAALAGCVSVDAPPPAPTPSPAPAAGVAGPARDVAPQIVEGPAREALEAALPTRPPSTPPRAAPPSGQPRRAVSPPRAQTPHPTSAPERGERARPAARPDLFRLPRLTGPAHDPSVTDVDVCDLGERYGGWAPGSDQARICQGAYGR